MIVANAVGLAHAAAEVLAGVPEVRLVQRSLQLQLQCGQRQGMHKRGETTTAAKAQLDEAGRLSDPSPLKLEVAF